MRREIFQELGPTRAKCAMMYSEALVRLCVVQNEHARTAQILEWTIERLTQQNNTDNRWIPSKTSSSDCERSHLLSDEKVYIEFIARLLSSLPQEGDVDTSVTPILPEPSGSSGVRKYAADYAFLR